MPALEGIATMDGRVTDGPEELPAGAISQPVPRTYLVAGTLEPFFLANATRWADALRAAGADVVMSERVAPHGGALWKAEFPLMVAWAFGRGGVRRAGASPGGRGR